MHRIIPPFPRLASLLLALGLLATACQKRSPAAGTGANPDAAPPKPTGPALKARRVAVVGASLSAGVGAKPLATLLRQALPPEVMVTDCADALTFRRPWMMTRQQLEKARAAKAEVVLALDTLFWFAYHQRTEQAKAAYLESGLKLLSEVRGVLFVGDLPDMRSAGGALIPKAHIPTAAMLKRFNHRIRAWAAKRPNVHVLPFSAWSKPLLGKGRIITAPGRPPIPAADALHIDGLHPNGKGTLYVLHHTLAAIRRAYPGTPAGHYRLTPKLIRTLTTL